MASRRLRLAPSTSDGRGMNVAGTQRDSISSRSGWKDFLLAGGLVGRKKRPSENMGTPVREGRPPQEVDEQVDFVLKPDRPPGGPEEPRGEKGAPCDSLGWVLSVKCNPDGNLRDWLGQSPGKPANSSASSLS